MLSKKSLQSINNFFLDYRSRIHDSAQTRISDFLNELERIFPALMSGYIPSQVAVATCQACKNISVWVSEDLIYPQATSLPPPNLDMDADIIEIYQEAEAIYLQSPKGATALLRLALQKLLKQIGKSGGNINQDIKELVSEGLSPQIQQALDILRVVGNNAVHPGQINFEDNSEIAEKLFEILNFIANELITKPKQLKQLYSELIPLSTQEHIKQRDNQ